MMADAAFWIEIVGAVGELELINVFYLFLS